MSFFDRQLDYVLFAGGLVFLLISAVSLHLSRRNTGVSGGVLRWGYFSLFALFQGVARWMTMGTIAYTPGPVYEYLSWSVMTLSFICLFESCRSTLGLLGERWRLGRWVYLLLVTVSLVGAFWGISGLEVAVGCVFGLTGPLLAGAALIAAGNRLLPSVKVLKTIGWALVVYGVVVALATGSGPFVSSRLPPDLGRLLPSFSVLTELLQLVVGATVLVGLWRFRYRTIPGGMMGERNMWLQIAMVVVVLVFLVGGWSLVEVVGNRAESEAQSRLLEQANIVALML
ncbi:MAG: hypothetical protein N3E40_01965, partial [Dehalococcoidia bacterium]|nr:hypothetical protein [Dehalococcoidia bacterium]